MEELNFVRRLKTFSAIFSYEKLFLGNQIKKLRKKAKMKQSALAKMLGTSQSAIARMENGKQNFSLSMLIKIGLVLDKKLNVKFQ